MKNYQLHPMFEDNSLPNTDIMQRINKEIGERGGLLHFRLELNENGWMAQCQEIKGIIAGAANPNPSQGEIVSNIRDAIRVAFNVPSGVSMAKFPIDLTLAVGATIG